LLLSSLARAEFSTVLIGGVDWNNGNMLNSVGGVKC